MRATDLFSRINALPPPVQGEVRRPPPEIVAFFVTFARRFRRWKRSALADIAGVSLSTIERVERGESVQTTSLEKIEKAFGLEPGYITKPRAPRSLEEIAAQFEQSARMEYVEVRPLKSQSLVRELAECHSFIPLSNVPQPDCRDEIFGLIEWLDLASFIRGDTAPRAPGENVSFRDLYTSILNHTKGMERLGYNVLAGVLNFPIEGIPDWKVAVLYVSNKKSDPGGQKRQFIPIDTTDFPKKVSLADCARWIDDDQHDQ